MTFTHDQLVFLHGLLRTPDQSEWVRAANVIFAAYGIPTVVIELPAAELVIRKFFNDLLENENYLGAATLLWGQDLFDARPQCVHDVFRTIQDNAMILLQGASSMTKCLGLGTQVIMFDGTTRKIEDVIPGDRLMGDDSTPRNVLSCGRGNGPLYRITPARGKPWVCNDAHILSLRWNTTKKCGSGYDSVTRVKGLVVDIPIRDYLALSKDKRNSLKQFSVGVDLPERTLPFDPYVYGAWIGDGGFDVPAIHSPEGPMTRRWCEYFSSLGYHITSGYHDKCPMWCARTRVGKAGPHAHNQFTDFIRTSRIGTEKIIRGDYLLNSRANRLGLLAGLLDSDGWVMNKTGYGFVSKYRQLAEQVQWLTKSLGFAATLCPSIHKIKAIGFSAEYWHVNISGSGISQIPTLEKHAIEPRGPKVLTNQGFAVEPIGTGDWAGVIIDGNHRFLLGDFTVTHNTYSCGAWCYLDWRRDPKYTSIKVAALSEDHLRKNIFSHIHQLHQASAIPYEDPSDIKDVDLYFGLRSAGNEFGFSGVAFKQSSEASGHFKGYKSKPVVRTIPHPKFGYMSRIRILGDEGQNWPAGPFGDFASQMASLDGVELYKVMISYNPESVSQRVVQLAEPEHGWQMEDMEKLYEWVSKEGWTVLRLDAKLSENVIQRKVIYRGFQTFEGFLKLLKGEGDVSNRYYCVDQKTEVLTDTGWKNWLGISIKDNIYTINPNNSSGEWCRVEEVFSKQYVGNMVRMENTHLSALVTPNHRWPVINNGKIKRGSKTLNIREIGDMSKYDIIPLCSALGEFPERGLCSDGMAALLGWVLAEGSISIKPDSVAIYQSQKANSMKCEIIRGLLSQEGLKHSEYLDRSGMSHFVLYGPEARKIIGFLGVKKQLSQELINGLTRTARTAIMDAMVMGDGGVQGVNTRYFCSSTEELADSFQSLVSTLGLSSNKHRRVLHTKFTKSPDGLVMYYVNVKSSTTTRNQYIRKSLEPYYGCVWCPRTANGTFLARRDGRTYFTGNTFARGWPPLASQNWTVVPPSWPATQRGEALFDEVICNCVSVDCAYQGMDKVLMTVGRFGFASGWTKYNGEVVKFLDPANPKFHKSRPVLQLDQQLMLAKSNSPTELAKEIKGKCIMMGIEPEWVAVDSTGQGSGTASFLKEYWGDILMIEWGKGATQMKVLAEDKNMAKDRYDSIISEMHFAFKEWLNPDICALLIHPQISANPLNTQMSTRRFRYVKGGKMSVESKSEYKARNQRSPDEHDGAIQLVHLIRSRAQVLPGMASQVDNRKIPDDDRSIVTARDEPSDQGLDLFSETKITGQDLQL